MGDLYFFVLLFKFFHIFFKAPLFPLQKLEMKRHKGTLAPSAAHYSVLQGNSQGLPQVEHLGVTGKGVPPKFGSRVSRY